MGLYKAIVEAASPGFALHVLTGDVLIFPSGHFLRVLAARWIGAEPIRGKSLMLGTASLSALGYENSTSQPALRLWNDAHHVLTSNGPDAARAYASASSWQTRR